MLCKKGVLREFTKFTGKHLCQSLFFNKVAGLRPATLLKKRLWHRCFPVNFVKFLRATENKTENNKKFIYIIQRRIYGFSEKKNPGRKLPGKLSPRRMPPENCALEKSLIDIKHFFTVVNNKLVNIKDWFTVNKLSSNVKKSKYSF